MSYKPLKINFVAYQGSNLQPAVIKLTEGVNIVYGASNTGKSLIAQVIDYMMGAKEIPKHVPENKGYTSALLGLTTSEGKESVLQRSLSKSNNGVIKIFSGGELANVRGNSYREIRAKKNRTKKGEEKSISDWLLSRIDLEDKWLRKNALGETDALSFRNIIKLSIVNEQDIIKTKSPFYSSIKTDETKYQSLLKLILTGEDDSHLIGVSISKNTKSKYKAQIDFIEELILENELLVKETPYEVADSQIKLIEVKLQEYKFELDGKEKEVSEYIKIRAELYQKTKELTDRIAEIKELLKKFDLLKQHYSSDLNRLQFIEESGISLFYENDSNCPLCGARPSDQHIQEDCEGNLEQIVMSAQVEKKKIEMLSNELSVTIEDLVKEQDSIIQRKLLVKADISSVEDKLSSSLSPSLEISKKKYSTLLENRNGYKRVIAIYDQIRALQRKRSNLKNKLDNANKVKEYFIDIDHNIIKELSFIINEILSKWNFPFEGKVSI